MAVLSKYQLDIFDINEDKWYNDIQVYTPFTLDFQISDNEDFFHLTENFIQYSTPNCNIVTLWTKLHIKNILL